MTKQRTLDEGMKVSMCVVILEAKESTHVTDMSIQEPVNKIWKGEKQKKHLLESNVYTLD